MAIIGNNADTLLHGLSGFWHRFFRDIKDIQVVYEGTEILLGQVYLNLLSDVLNTDVQETPLFRQEYYKLITVREDELEFREHGDTNTIPAAPMFYGNPGTDRYVYTSDTFFGSIPRLQDVIYAPTTSLEEGVDYRVAGGEIQFKTDPTDPAMPGLANRRVTVGIGGQFSSTTLLNWVAAGVEKGDTLYFSERVNLGTVPPLSQSSPSFATWLALQNGVRSARVVQVDVGMISVASDTPLPKFPEGAVPAGFSWRVMRLRDDGIYNTTLPRAAALTDGQLAYTSTLDVTEVSLWAVDAKVDDLALYNTYGYFFFDKPALSSEAYRALLRGLMQLYILGPALERLESALNLTANLPTVLAEGEILQSYNNGILATGVTGVLLAGDIFQVPINLFTPGSVGGFIRIRESDDANNIGTANILEYLSPTQVKLRPLNFFTPDTGIVWDYTRDNKQAVTTDQATYLYPLNTPIRVDVTTPANFGVLTFRAFEPLTTAIRVTDYIQDPGWWHQITIPQEILPDWASTRRVVTPQLFPNVIGPTNNAYIGDPGFYIGADEEGQEVAEPYRHKASFILLDRFLKAHIFAVILDPSVNITGVLVSDLNKILRDVKPVHTALYFQPSTQMRDVISIWEATLSAKPIARMTSEEVGLIGNELLIGSAWNIGDTWAFAGAAGGAVAVNPGASGIYVVIGGLDPAIQPAAPSNVPPVTPTPDLRWIDRPVYVVRRAFP